METIIGTWSFSFKAVKHGSEFLKQNKSCLDATEAAINLIEDDESFGPCIVGKGGIPNSRGQLELDAALMEGQTLRFGSVTALQGVTRAVSVARAVMEHSLHSMLTGEGAHLFAKERGFLVEAIPSPTLKETVMETRAGHDTLGIISLRRTGEESDIAVGVSTSGAPGKHPGRVGDSALPGCGLYANSHGAACCSGDGDELLKFCPAFSIVQLISQGVSPQEACETVIREIVEKMKNATIEAAVIATDKTGNFGACSTVEKSKDPMTNIEYKGFPYVVWTSSKTDPEIKVAKTIACVK